MDVRCVALHVDFAFSLRWFPGSTILLPFPEEKGWCFTCAGVLCSYIVNTSSRRVRKL